jgi:Domain of unknown function (DU1801)
MAELKTKPTVISVVDFLAAADPAKQADALVLDALFQRVTGFQPRMWGPTMVGYGRYAYTYDSGHSGESLASGFSPRKAEFSLYVGAGDAAAAPLLARLGKHKIGKGCLYVKRLSDIDTDVLAELISTGLARLQERCAVHPT